MEILAPAKLNLSLDILRKREDGYHDLRMVMHSVDLTDQLVLERGSTPGLQVKTDLAFLPNNEKNLAAIAALRFADATGMDIEALQITIRKQIPVCAGMAGGSSDAAAVLRALNGQLEQPMTLQELARIGEKIGSDVPYCVLGGTALAEGRGEILTALPPLPPCWFVLCKPSFSISTPELFGRVRCSKLHHRPDTKGQISALERGDLSGVARRMYNVFEDVLPDRYKREIDTIKATLVSHGALGAVMSGSGPTVFGIFGQLSQAQVCFDALQQSYKQTFLVKSV